MMRTHTCNDLRKDDAGKNVTLCGWIQSRRDFGSMSFIDLRDRYGITQLVFNTEDLKNQVSQLLRESVITVQGKVSLRKEGEANKERKTGEIEIIVEKLEILSKADPLPIELDESAEVTEDTRLTYRFLDLRKKSMQHNLTIRHKAVKAVRDFFDKHNFIEIETPILTRSTPEGARDYLVPSRVNPGKFFALPQSPQLFKQLLMVSGFDRYVQIVKCFRDEDLRADRQPEFTQIDVEMSFIEEDDIYPLMEDLVKDVWEKVLDATLKTPFQKLTYAESMERFGTDRPDMRFAMELFDVSDIMKDSDFKIFKDIIADNGIVKGMNAQNCASYSRKDIDSLEALAKVYGAKGLVWLKVKDNKLEGPIAKFLDEETTNNLIEKAKAKNDDLILLISDTDHYIANTALSFLRVEIAKRLDILKRDDFNFVWVNEFPLLEFDHEEKRHVAVHHPFTSPMEEDLDKLESNTTDVRAKAYDLVLNGVEIGGGSIRIHKKELQERVFKLLGISDEEAKQKFGFLLEAFRYGAPPHGGIAFGLDRMITLMLGIDSIRDVIAFPKNKAAISLMDSAPNVVDEAQLDELGISLKK